MSQHTRKRGVSQKGAKYTRVIRQKMEKSSSTASTPSLQPRALVDPLQHITSSVWIYTLLPMLQPVELHHASQVSSMWRVSAHSYMSKVFGKVHFGANWWQAHAETMHLPGDLAWYCAQYLTRPTGFISKSTAQNHLRLTPKQCAALPARLCPNPSYKRAAPMQLMKIRDTFAACIERHSNVQGLQTYKKRLMNQKAVRKVNAQQAIIDRREDLETALQEFHLKIRNDSALCRLWLENPTKAAAAGYTLTSVVRRCCEMRYLFDHSPQFRTAMETIEERRSDDRAYLEANWHDSDAHADFHDSWDDVDMVAEAERSAHVEFPTQWPWMQRENKKQTSKKTK